jgi:hypothetical protein
LYPMLGTEILTMRIKKSIKNVNDPFCVPSCFHTFGVTRN